SGSPVGVYGSNGGTNQAWALRSLTPTGAVQQQVSTPVGTVPTLPATLTPTYAWGNGAPVAVSWQNLPASAWKKAGTTTLKGTATDVFGNTVTGALLVVAGAYDVTDPTSATVSAGVTLASVEAAAPTTVRARIGDVVDRTFPAHASWDWSTLSDASFSSPGVVAVNGTVASNDPGSPDLPATLNVIVVGAGGTTNLCGPGTTVTVAAGYTEGSYAASRTCDGTVSTSNYWSDWNSTGMNADTLTYTLGASHVVGSVAVTPTERAPLSVTVQYRDASGNWVNTSAVGVTGFANDTTKSVAFTPVSTSALRLQLTLNYYTKISEVAINAASPAPSAVATLAALRIGNTPVSGFAADTASYQIVTPGGNPSVVTAVATDSNAKVSIDQATKKQPVATVTVVAVDGTTQAYTVTFVKK
ncbi:MAG: Ig-like domain-containing protein, partial [Humibacter sp.]